MPFTQIDVSNLALRAPDFSCRARLRGRYIDFISTTTAKQNSASLFFGSPDRQNSRIPAGVERPLADNFLQKQQKQWNPLQRGNTRRFDGQPPKGGAGRGHTVTALLLRLAGLVLLLAAVSSTARADDFAALVGGLAADSFADKER